MFEVRTTILDGIPFSTIPNLISLMNKPEYKNKILLKNIKLTGCFGLYYEIEVTLSDIDYLSEYCEVLKEIISLIEE